MIPLRDDIPSSIAPVVNYSLIGACTLVFLVQLSLGDRVDRFVERYGMVPAQVTHPEERIVVESEEIRHMGPMAFRVPVRRELERPPFHPWLTILTCIFLHGGWMHFLGNMLFLYIFGDNVEDRLGHVGYLAFYLGMGVAASLTHYVTGPDSVVPTIGASGAIAGVMGAYFLLYPGAQVLTLVPIFYFLEFVVLPAYVFLGLWFVIQFFQGTFALTGREMGGVAWWAHVGGFAAGAAVLYLLRAQRWLRQVRPRYEHARPFSHYRQRPW